MAYVQVHLMSVKTKQGDETKQSQIINGTIHGYYIHSAPPLLPPPSAVKWWREAKRTWNAHKWGDFMSPRLFNCSKFRSIQQSVSPSSDRLDYLQKGINKSSSFKKKRSVFSFSTVI